MEHSIDEFLTIVDDAEFNLLSKLSGDYLHADDGCLTRLEGNEVYVIMRQAEWDRMERIRKEVEQEIALQEQVAQDVATQIKRAVEVELQPPKVETKQETRAQSEYRRLFVEPPNHPPSSRPPDWASDRFGGN